MLPKNRCTQKGTLETSNHTELEANMRSKRKPKQSELWGRNHLIGMVVLAALVFAGIFYVALRAKPLRQEDATAGPIPIYFGSAADAMAFPATLDPLKFQRRDIREAYQVAKEIPEVLAQQPCYCYCEPKGHRGLLDCFRTGHAASCDICIKEALLAGQMHRQGKSTDEIRRAIIQGPWASDGSSNR
jgi:hypothetical protein